MEIFSWSTIWYWIGNVVWQFLSHGCREWLSCMNFLKKLQCSLHLQREMRIVVRDTLSRLPPGFVFSDLAARDAASVIFRNSQNVHLAFSGPKVPLGALVRWFNSYLRCLPPSPWTGVWFHGSTWEMRVWFLQLSSTFHIYHDTRAPPHTHTYIC